MSLNDEERKIIVSLEKEKSLNTFSEIGVLCKVGLWNNIANRIYYAAFHAVVALLISDGHMVNTHQGAAVLLNQHYIKNGLISRDMGSFYSRLQTMREKSDYNCTYNATEQDIIPLIEPTKRFIDTIFSLIEK